MALSSFTMKSVKSAGDNLTFNLQMNLFRNSVIKEKCFKDSELQESFSTLPKTCMNIIT
ncbi:hypothetical protein PRJBM_01508 [Bartonella henselae]|nr:hypothetical protein PRJBM_01508 [Bartonella henselae]CUH91427.1 hypothetical protein BM1374164_01508 [Bartonella henselae]